VQLVQLYEHHPMQAPPTERTRDPPRLRGRHRAQARPKRLESGDFPLSEMDLTGHHSNPSRPLEALLEGRSGDRRERTGAKNCPDGAAAEQAASPIWARHRPARLGAGGGPPCPCGAERADAGSRRAWRRRGSPRRASAVGVGQEVPELERDRRLAAVRSGGSRSVRREPRDERRGRYRSWSEAGVSRSRRETLGSPPVQG
jgi:hypothetical protein